jgi:hypothetical protein
MPVVLAAVVDHRLKSVFSGRDSVAAPAAAFSV